MDRRRIGIIGAHRTGKSTIAQEVANELAIPYVDASVGSDFVWKNSGYQYHDRVTFLERLEIQEALLEGIGQKLYAHQNQPNWVIDRSPIDILAYLMVSLDDTCTRLVDGRVKQFREQCIELTEEYYSQLVIVQPEIEYDEVRGKAGKVFKTAAMQDALTDIITGVCLRQVDVEFFILPTNLTPGNRIKYVTCMVTGNVSRETMAHEMITDKIMGFENY